MCKRILLTIPNFDTAGSGKAMLRIANKRQADTTKKLNSLLQKHQKRQGFSLLLDNSIRVKLRYDSECNVFWIHSSEISKKIRISTIFEVFLWCGVIPWEWPYWSGFLLGYFFLRKITICLRNIAIFCGKIMECCRQTSKSKIKKVAITEGSGGRSPPEWVVRRVA